MQAEGLYGDMKGHASDAVASGQQKAGKVLEGARGAIPDVRFGNYSTACTISYCHCMKGLLCTSVALQYESLEALNHLYILEKDNNAVKWVNLRMVCRSKEPTMI